VDGDAQERCHAEGWSVSHGHKLTLMAHSIKHYQELGGCGAAGALPWEELAATYEPSHGGWRCWDAAKHVNVLHT